MLGQDCSFLDINQIIAPRMVIIRVVTIEVIAFGVKYLDSVRVTVILESILPAIFSLAF